MAVVLYYVRSSGGWPDGRVGQEVLQASDTSDVDTDPRRPAEPPWAEPGVSEIGSIEIDGAHVFEVWAFVYDALRLNGKNVTGEAAIDNVRRYRSAWYLHADKPEGEPEDNDAPPVPTSSVGADRRASWVNVRHRLRRIQIT
jgi:hypothetical protein